MNVVKEIWDGCAALSEVQQGTDNPCIVYSFVASLNGYWPNLPFPLFPFYVSTVHLSMPMPIHQPFMPSTLSGVSPFLQDLILLYLVLLWVCLGYKACICVSQYYYLTTTRGRTLHHGTTTPAYLPSIPCSILPLSWLSTMGYQPVNHGDTPMHTWSWGTGWSITLPLSTDFD